MATGDPARAPGSAARGWRARARPEGESAPWSSVTRGGFAARVHRRLARPCLANVTAGAAGGSSSPDEVFGLAKKPKNLAEIYKAPTDLCFQGTFEELRDAGRAQGRWLLVNIQSPTEFASQQLNADTWTDETAGIVTMGPGIAQWYEDTLYLNSGGEGIMAKVFE